MEKIINIFVQLGVDHSIFYQFAIFIIIFALLKVVFFNKLLLVIQTRELNTTKLDEEADAKIKKAEKLSQEFEKAIQETNEVAHHKMSELKSNGMKEILVRQKGEEEKILEDFEKRKKQAINEIESHKATIFSKADELSNTLIEKVIN